jgi:hypothetical protein
MNVNDKEDDNPEATVPMRAAISGGLNIFEMELQIPKNTREGLAIRKQSNGLF